MENPAVAAVPVTTVAVTAAPTPFTLGRVLGRTFTIWGRNALPFSLIVLVVHLPMLALSLWSGAPPEPGTYDPDAQLSYTVRTYAAAIVGGLLALVSAGALTAGALQSLAGRRASTGELLGAAFRNFGRIFAVAFLTGLRVLGWMLLFVVPGVMALCRYFVSVPAAVAEPGVGATEAIDRSADLTQGRRLAIFVVLVVFWLLGTTLAVWLMVPLRVGAISWTTYAAVTWATGAIAGSLKATASAVAYHDLRLEKEGASTDQLAAVFE